LELNKIIKGCKRNSLKHQEMLYREFHAYGMSISLRYANNREDALEILNDSFLKVFENISKFDIDKVFKSWFRKIIINTAIDYSRKYAIIYKLEDINDYQTECIDEGKIDNLDLEEIMEMLNRLPNLYRLIFNLHEIEGYKHSEIAEKLNINESTSRTNLTRAKKMLRSFFEQNNNKPICKTISINY